MDVAAEFMAAIINAFEANKRLADRAVLPRGQRAEALARYAAAYACRLEKHVLEDPFQWYNFYDFWRPAGPTDPA